MIMPTYYSYNCQVCGTRSYMQSSIRRCNLCLKSLCKTHSIHGFCPTHDRVLLHDEKVGIRTAYYWQKNACGCMIGFMFLFILLEIIPIWQVPWYIYYNPAISMVITILIAIILSIIIHFSAQAAWKSKSFAAINRLKQEYGQPSGSTAGQGTQQNTPFPGLSNHAMFPQALPSTLSPVTSAPLFRLDQGSANARSPMEHKTVKKDHVCHACGAIISDATSDFCGYCGAKLADEKILTEKPWKNVAMDIGGATNFSATAWSDPAFLAFIKEYWEYNFGAKYRNIAMTFIAHVKPDGAAVNERIVAYFDVQNGTCKPYLVKNKLPHYLVNSIELAGSPAEWQRAVDQGDMTVLKDGKVLVIKNDPLLPVKASLGKTFPSIVKRVWTRMCDGGMPGIPVESNVVLGDDDLYAVHRVIAFNLNVGSGIDMLKIIKDELYKRYLQQLADTRQGNIDEFWNNIAKLPNLDDFRGVKPVDLPMELAADPFLKRDMLAIKDLALDDGQKIDMARDLLERRRG